MNPFELRLVPIEQLQPADYNPRKALAPKSPAYRKLKASLTEFGLVEPLVWNELTGRVVGGHARLRILKGAGRLNDQVAVTVESAAYQLRQLPKSDCHALILSIILRCVRRILSSRLATLRRSVASWTLLRSVANHRPVKPPALPAPRCGAFPLLP